VGASDYLPYPIWAKKFLHGQGYALKENNFHQDNLSTIRFCKNGRKSCGPNSRHIDIRYFFIKDRLEIEDFSVVHCPTEQMLADFFTKPLQGSLFKKLKAVIMGHAHIDSLKRDAPVASQERVGEDIVPTHDEKVGATPARKQATMGETEATIVPEATMGTTPARSKDARISPQPVKGLARPKTTESWVKVVKRRSARKIVRFESERSRIESPLTLKK
jgi:hypothetical protein